MYIVKRDGRNEEMLLDKITSRIKKLCYGLDKKYVDPSLITLKVNDEAGFREAAAPLGLYSVGTPPLPEPRHLSTVTPSQIRLSDTQSLCAAPQVVQGVFPGIKTTELDELSAQTGELHARAQFGRRARWMLRVS